MKIINFSRKLRQVLASPQFAVCCVTLLTAETVSARAPMGLPDPSMLSVWGSAAVIGVIAYRIKKRK